MRLTGRDIALMFLYQVEPEMAFFERLCQDLAIGNLDPASE
jgi:hypothetical protein